MKRLKVVISNERLITPSGLSIVGTILGNSDFVKNCNKYPLPKKRSEPYIKTSDILLTEIGILCQGKHHFEAVNEFKEDPDFFKLAMGIQTDIPSEETLRQRMDYIGNSMRKVILDTNVSMFNNYEIKPTAMSNGYVPVDIDVTPFDNSKTSKEGTKRTYKNFDGYAPIMAYIGTEGFLANCELREGSQHCQKGTPDFLKETLRLSHKMTNDELLIRMDSGNDAQENLGILMDDGSWFIVKRNLRREDKSEWMSKIKEWCLKENIQNPREGKTVYIGTTFKECEYVNKQGEGCRKMMRVVYEGIERTIDKHGQYLLEPEIEVNMWWTNVSLSDKEIIEQYHAHAECEQYHSEIKTDMDIERLPSGKFKTNELIMELTILAYNILRMIGQESLRSNKSPRTRKKVKRRRLRTVINNLILIASKITTHSRGTIMSLGRSNIWRDAFVYMHRKFSMA